MCEEINPGWRRVAPLAFALVWAITGLSANAAETPAKGSDGLRNRWIAISEQVTSQVKCSWPGLTAGVAVDRTNGDVYMVASGQGIWKSSDRGATFARVDGNTIGGRCETGYALCADPNGKRLCCFMLDGASGYTLDGGKSWERLAQQGRGWDYAAVDWSADRPQVFFGLEHESGGKRWLSGDGGKRWNRLSDDPKMVNASPFGLGVADGKTLVRWVGKMGIERSLDAGATWTKVSGEIPVSRVMVVFKGVCYWLGEKGLLVSKDKGVTWSVQGRSAQAAWGPYFGKNENHIVAVGKSGIQETTDGGQNWQTVASLPDELKDLSLPGWFLNFAFDPVNDIFYASRMGKATYKYER
ncbi:MAG: hypothetical protein NTX50_05070 [Candidatus Sumerlaeota bacterium]|nr:hypothetical protein [Candidatus Sumerlaeota bacterium]